METSATSSSPSSSSSSSPLARIALLVSEHRLYEAQQLCRTLALRAPRPGGKRGGTSSSSASSSSPSSPSASGAYLLVGGINLLSEQGAWIEALDLAMAFRELPGAQQTLEADIRGAAATSGTGIILDPLVRVAALFRRACLDFAASRAAGAIDDAALASSPFEATERFLLSMIEFSSSAIENVKQGSASDVVAVSAAASGSNAGNDSKKRKRPYGGFRGVPQLHLELCRICAASGDYQRALMNLTHAHAVENGLLCDMSELVSAAVELFRLYADSVLPSERDIVLARIVLGLVGLTGNLRGANAVFEDATSGANSSFGDDTDMQDSGSGHVRVEVTNSPLVNFTRFVLLTCERELAAYSVFVELQKRYAPAIARDEKELKPTLDSIATRMFGVTPARPSPGGAGGSGNLLGSLMQGLMSGGGGGAPPGHY